MESRTPTPPPQLSRYPKVPKALAGLVLGILLGSLIILGIGLLV